MTRQVIQNLVVFAGVLFSHQWGSVNALIRSLLAFFILCTFSYAVKFTVDMVHTGGATWDMAIMEALGHWPRWFRYFMLVICVASLVMKPMFGLVLFVYLLIAFAHDLFFRKKVIVDVISLALEFSLKAIAGVVILKDVALSPWLVGCAFLVSLVVSLGKRRNEVALLKDAPDTSQVLAAGYSERLLDQMMAVVTSSTFVAYTLYTISDRTRLFFGSTHLLFTTPFVLYGILRYLYIVNQKDLTEGSEVAILKDVPMVINMLIWFGLVVTILRWG